MRLRTLLTSGILLAAMCAPLWAAEQPLNPTPEDYGKLCRDLNALTGRSVAEIRSSLEQLAGKYVEIRGRVLGRTSGQYTDSGLVDVLLKCNEDSCFVACPPGYAEVQPGRCVRMLVQVPEQAGDIDDCFLKAVTEDPTAREADRPAPSGDGKRLEIGEAAFGVRDQAPDFGPATSTAGPQLPQIPYQPPQTGSMAPQAGAALPPEMRGMPSLSGRTAAQPAGPAQSGLQVASRPTIQFANQQGRQYTYEDAVRVWVDWVRKQNSDLSAQQADLLVRWTLYYAAQNQVDHRLIFAVMKAESDFNPRCVSHAGAMGLMQLMPCNVTDFRVKDPFDIAENIRGGVEHLAEFLRKYAGKSTFEQTVLALACYNAGPGAVAKHGGVPPYAETQNYVRKVPALFKLLYDQGYP
jgi:soluble lytic murein transglycosylase-like protein